MRWRELRGCACTSCWHSPSLAATPSLPPTPPQALDHPYFSSSPEAATPATLAALLPRLTSSRAAKADELCVSRSGSGSLSAAVSGSISRSRSRSVDLGSRFAEDAAECGSSGGGGGFQLRRLGSGGRGAGGSSGLHPGGSSGCRSPLRPVPSLLNLAHLVPGGGRGAGRGGARGREGAGAAAAAAAAVGGGGSRGAGSSSSRGGQAPPPCACLLRSRLVTCAAVAPGEGGTSSPTSHGCSVDPPDCSVDPGSSAHTGSSSAAVLTEKLKLAEGGTACEGGSPGGGQRAGRGRGPPVARRLSSHTLLGCSTVAPDGPAAAVAAACAASPGQAAAAAVAGRDAPSGPLWQAVQAGPSPFLMQAGAGPAPSSAQAGAAASSGRGEGGGGSLKRPRSVLGGLPDEDEERGQEGRGDEAGQRAGQRVAQRIKTDLA